MFVSDIPRPSKRARESNRCAFRKFDDTVEVAKLFGPIDSVSIDGEGGGDANCIGERPPFETGDIGDVASVVEAFR